MTAKRQLQTTRRRFLALCGAVAGASLLPAQMRLSALRSMATVSFQLTGHERSVLRAAANAIAPGTDITHLKVNTRLGPKAMASAGNAGEHTKILRRLSVSVAPSAPWGPSMKTWPTWG